MHYVLKSVKQRQIPLGFRPLFFKTLVLSLLFLTSCCFWTIEFDKALIAKSVTIATLSSARPYLQGRAILLIIIARVTANTLEWNIAFTVYQFMKSSTDAWRIVNYPISILFCFEIFAKDPDFLCQILFDVRIVLLPEARETDFSWTARDFTSKKVWLFGHFIVTAHFASLFVMSLCYSS